MNNPFNRSLLIGYGCSILMLLLIGGVSYVTLDRMLESDHSVTHSTRVMRNLEELLSHMKDAETGQRGYLLTNREIFLTPYHGAVADAMRLTKETQQLTIDNPTQQHNLANIHAIIARRLNILQTIIDKHTARQVISATDLDSGKYAMDALRSAVAKAENDEQHLLDVRSDKLRHYSGLVPILILIALFIAIIISVFSYIKVVSDMRKQERLNRELADQEAETAALNEELSAANEEITAANEELVATNEELLEAREALAEANTLLEQRVAERTQDLQDSEEETQALNEELMAINEELGATNEELTATNEELADNQYKLQKSIGELRLAEERSAKLVAIVESSDDAIIGKDLDGVVTSWNRGAEQIFGYLESQIIGKSILTLIPEDLHHEEPVILGRLRNGEKIDHYETVRRTQDGRMINVSLTISPIRDTEGQVIGISKIARDITEQKRDEQRKNDFIGMASHELKTPLTSLTALIQVLQHKLRNYPESFVPASLDKANLQVKKMSSLINGFLNISRLESGKLEIIKSSFDLNALIADELDEIRLTVASHEFIFEANGISEINADREKIGSVISNLLSNAVKYSPKGKTVTINCRRLENEVQVSISDNGMGIKSQDLSRIFDRYYRSSSIDTQHISGFGVGLYLSAEIIQRHNGRIWAESEKAIGSTFYFTLPI